MTKTSKVIINNLVFGMHYALTLLFYIILILVVSFNQIYEEIVRSQDGDTPSKYLDDICLKFRTCSHDKVFTKFQNEKKFISPTNKYPSYSNAPVFNADDDWLLFILIVEAIVFYIPKCFWNFKEYGRTKKLMSFLSNTNRVKTENVKQLVKSLIADTNKNKTLFTSCFVAEILNAVNVTASLFILEHFLSRSPSSNGIDVIECGEINSCVIWRLCCSSNKTPLHKCCFRTVKETEAMAFLPINILYENVCGFFSYWLIILAVLSYLVIAYRILLIHSPQLRVEILKILSKTTESADLDVIMKMFGIGDWFLIYLLSKNVDPETFSDVISNLVKIVDVKLDDSVP
ncbi:innexin inx1 [Nephila pilipes]|uniref:Innexin n=1 Tax=Nephila pilipes TaxID=299642 RepID=A0A8X6NK91_NEPPI|nr:innexin inx1 [Nephila pilipes]